MARLLSKYRMTAWTGVRDGDNARTVLPAPRSRQQRRRTFIFAIAVFVLGFAGAAQTARAAEQTFGVFHYTIEHSLFGRIGTQTVRLARKGHDIVVTVNVRAKVELLFFTLLRLRTSGREVWRDGRMVTFDGRTEEDGDTVVVSARANSGRVVIEGPGGKRDIAGPVALTNPWHSAVLMAPVLLEPTSGELLYVRSRFAGEESIVVGGQIMAARKHIVTGDINAEIWFAGDGTWVRMEFARAGGRVTIALESSPPSGNSPLAALVDPRDQGAAVK